MIKNQGTKQREQRSLGDCWQWKANGQCSKRDNCSFRHDINKRAKSTQPNPSPSSFMQQSVKNASRTTSPRGRSPSVKMARLPCWDYLKGTCTTPFCEKWHPPECLFHKSENGCRFGEKCPYGDGLARITSKELAPNSFCEKWHPPECLFYESESGCRCGEKCSYAHRQVDEQPSKRAKKNGDKSAVAMLKKYTTIGLRISGYGAADVFIDFAEELNHTESNPMCSIH